MVAATRWRQDRHSAPTNPYQRLRWYPTFPSGGGGYSTFGWSPTDLPDGVRVIGGMTRGGLSGAPLLPGWSGLAKVIGAVAGIAAGAWLARENLSR